MSHFQAKTRNLFRWLRLMFKWLMEMRAAWSISAINLLCLLTAIYFASDLTFRWTGLVLQVVGIYTVMVDIRNRRRQFRLPKTLLIFANWIQRRPKLNGQTIIAMGAATSSGPTGRVRLDLWRNIPPDGDIESRLDAAVKNLILIKDQIDRFERVVEEQVEIQRSDLIQEQKARTDGDDKTHKTIEEAATGGLSLSLMGLWCLLIGVVMSTGSVELACLVNYILG